MQVKVLWNCGKIDENVKINVYDNEYASLIDIYFYEYFHLALALQTFLDTLSNI